MKWLFRFAGLVFVIAAVAVISLLMLPGDRIARIAADQLSALSGREVTMEGETAVSFYPVLGISTGAVTIANADWAGDEPMFQAASLKIGVEPQALFGGDIRITGLEAVAPRINLERSADGRVNWQVGVEGVAPSGQSDGAVPARSNRLALTLDRALITDASLVYTDRQAGRQTAIPSMDFDLRWPEFDGTATFDIALRPSGQDEVKIDGALDRVGHFLDGGVSDVNARIVAPGGSLSFAGRAGLQPQMAGRLTGDIGNTSQFLSLLGLGDVNIPAGLGRSVGLDAQLSLTEEMRLSLRDASLQLDGNRLTGAADILLSGSKPRLNVQLDAGALDLSGLSADDGGEGAGAGGGSVAVTGWSKAPIDASALSLVDGEVALVADSVDLGDFTLGKTRTLMRLDQSRLVFELREVRAYNGLITGEFVLNNRSGLSVGGNLAAGAIDMETFLADAMDITRFSGSADARVSFLGVGPSLHAIMNSLSGDGAVNTGRGVISGIDLDKLMRSGDVTGGTTVFDSLAATFTMKDGNLRNDDLLMTLPLAKATGEGRIGLGQQDIDYLFTPVLLEGESRRGLAIPVRIRGPWANPRITPDIEKAIDLNLREEKKELESRARDEIERAIEKELGVTAEEGQSLEDALRDKIEDEAKKGLLRLFD